MGRWSWIRPAGRGNPRGALTAEAEARGRQRTVLCGREAGDAAWQPWPTLLALRTEAEAASPGAQTAFRSRMSQGDRLSLGAPEGTDRAPDTSVLALCDYVGLVTHRTVS